MRLALVLATFVIMTGGVRAEPDEPLGVVTYTGICNGKDNLDHGMITSFLCSNILVERIFEDSNSSIEFKVVDSKGHNTRNVVFEGPGWSQIDKNHFFMVMREVKFRTYPIRPVLNIELNGFCLFTLHPYTITCGYNTPNVTHVFTFNITKKKSG